LLEAACSAIYDVSYDYDQEADFTQLRSYDWLAIPKGVEAVRKILKNFPPR